jgi:2-keto-3-deoxy-L-rhamnonate aldolase RhmA
MDIKQIRETLHRGGIVLGSEVNEVRSPAIAEIYAAAGLDFILVDMEHTSFTLSEAAQIFRVARNCGIVPLVRIPQIDYSVICRNLDQGAKGIIVPRVSSRKEVLEVLDIMKYPPRGRRGIYPGGTSVGYRALSAVDFVKEQNDSILLVIQIESETAVRKLDEIITVPGIDVVLVGPADLSLSIGLPGDFHHEKVATLMKEIVEKCTQNGIPSGVAHWDPKYAQLWRKEGMQFFWINNDVNMLLAGAKTIVQEMRN